MTTTSTGDEWSDEDLAEYSSVLDLAKGAGRFRSLSLRWHYRSRHESLIAFSNHRFYGGELITFPGPEQESDDLGVVASASTVSTGVEPQQTIPSKPRRSWSGSSRMPSADSEASASSRSQKRRRH